ncbi:transposase domain-containing protein [Paenibacillus sp. GbtcB18]|uniref:transposase domain-containing protein n=1 Tax=Paenibacillus sp. GbtcB18 TaxID=2824763 RepID=UPI0028165B75|nr:transposase domain-containing protein [Paenibacillus sp. GbtcB18]
MLEDKKRGLPVLETHSKWLHQQRSRLYSIIETAKENGLPPFKYLMHLFEKLPQLEAAITAPVQ